MYYLTFYGKIILPMIEKGGMVEKNKEEAWRETRTATLQSLKSPINLLAIDISRFDEKIEALEEAGKPVDQSLQEGQDALRRVLSSLIDELHLTVGGESCSCPECRSMITRLVAPDHHPFKLRGYRTEYKKDVYALIPVAEREPEEGEEVLVVFPFIGDNLLHKQVQPITVRPIDFSPSERL